MTSDATGAGRDAPRRPSFRSPQAEAEFQAAYDAVLATWAVDVEALDVPTVHGSTRVNACGPEDGPAVVLLHGGGATSTVWAGVAPVLADAGCRVLAVDQVGAAGRSVHDGPALRAPADLTAWLGDVLDRVGAVPAVVVGHSYGAWLALRYAVDRPAAVRRLVLLDPTDCYVGLRAAYRARAVPVLLAPDAGRTRRFLAWETAGTPLPGPWLRLACLAAEVRTSRLVLPRRPSGADLARVTAPVLQLVAGRGRAVDPARSVREAARRHPGLGSQVLPEASHHTLPLLDGDVVARAVLAAST